MKSLNFGRMAAVFALFASFAVGSIAGAFDGRCLLEVDGVEYINQVCNIEFTGGGSFAIGTSDPRTDYFAYVNIYEGVAQGYWNGIERGSHAHSELGILHRQFDEEGRATACWQNARAKVCAWR